MPHDKNGNVIKSGDFVTIKFLVKDVYNEDGFCNVNLVSTEVMPGNGYPLNVSSVNTRQTELVKE